MGHHSCLNEIIDHRSVFSITMTKIYHREKIPKIKNIDLKCLLILVSQGLVSLIFLCENAKYLASSFVYSEATYGLGTRMAFA